jgi:NADPH:quinone reductase-like Zn-dependent oxidoreductase
VDSTEKLDMLRSLGADHVIDYKQEDFTKHGQRYDLIIDVVDHRSIFKYKHSLLPDGILVLVGDTISAIFQTAFLGSLISMTGNRKMGVLVHKPNKNLALITELFEAGKTIPVIDKIYPLSEVPEAIKNLGEGRVKGKIVISVVQSKST